jgi:3-hydroxyisobutyrate dehydrogenase-like beta-hydroxyacid dehydrogenase
MQVGFIGFGNMGMPMCTNLIAAGHDVCVFDLRPEATKACKTMGATVAQSAADAASEVEVVMTSLPRPSDVEAVAIGANGIIEGAAPGTIYADLTTNSPVVSKRVGTELAAKDIAMIDAPVSGGVVGARKATLAIMAGGDEAAYQICLPLFEAMGQNISHLGEQGCGCVANIVNNLIAFCSMAAGAEGLMLGAAAGIDPVKLDNVIRASSGNSMAYRGIARKSLEGDWSPSFTVDLAYKDMHLALELADELEIPLPLSAQVHNLMRMAKGLGFGSNDASAIMRVYETTLQRTVRG